MSEPFRVISHGYQELRGSFPSSKEEAEISADPDPLRLSDLLDDMDQLKHEIHERIRHMEAINQAKTLIREDEARTESFTSKIAEIQKAVRATRSEPDRINLDDSQADSLSFLNQKSALDFQKYELLETPRQHRQPAGFLPLVEQIETANESNREFLASIDCSYPREPDTGKTSEPDTRLNASYQLIARAEDAWRKAETSVQEAKLVLEQSILQMNQACAREEQAASDLRSTQQELTTAYQFAAAAAKMQKDAALYSRKATLWAIGAATMAWITAAWFAWISFHARMTILAPIAATAIMIGTGLTLERWSKREY